MAISDLERAPGTVSRLDTRTDAVRQTETGHRPLGIAVTDGRLWVGLELSAAEGVRPSRGRVSSPLHFRRTWV